MTTEQNEIEKEADQIIDAASETVEMRRTHAPLPEPEFEETMVDEELLETTCFQLFELYQKTGNHEVRRLAQLTVQGFAALLGADPREFFPDAPPIRDSGDPQGAPTYAGAPGQGWPRHQEIARSGFPNRGMNIPMPAETGQVHQSNPSGAEMRVVSDPGGTMLGRPVNPNYQPPMPGQQDNGGYNGGYQNQQGQQVQRRRRRRG